MASRTSPRTRRPATKEKRAVILHALALLRRLGTATNEWQRGTLDEGFTVNQALVLHHLVSHGDATPSDLAAWMRITRGSVTPTIKRLEDLGLVKRTVDESDGRKQRLTATAEAHAIAPDLDVRILRPIFRELDAWAVDDLHGFTRHVERLLESGILAARP